MAELTAAEVTAFADKNVIEKAEAADLVMCIHGLRRKRILSSRNSAKNTCGEESSLSRLETLPEEVLIRVLCCVDHEDLDQLVRVSQTIREAALVAKRLHFAYSTPTKATAAFQNSVDLEDSFSLATIGDHADVMELEPPMMKKRRIARPQIDATRMAAVAVALFTDEAD